MQKSNDADGNLTTRNADARQHYCHGEMALIALTRVQTLYYVLLAAAGVTNSAEPNIANANPRCYGQELEHD